MKFVEILEVECEETEDSKPVPYILYTSSSTQTGWLFILVASRNVKAAHKTEPHKTEPHETEIVQVFQDCLS